MNPETASEDVQIALDAVCYLISHHHISEVDLAVERYCSKNNIQKYANVVNMLGNDSVEIVSSALWFMNLTIKMLLPDKRKELMMQFNASDVGKKLQSKGNVVNSESLERQTEIWTENVQLYLEED